MESYGKLTPPVCYPTMTPRPLRKPSASASWQAPRRPPSPKGAPATLPRSPGIHCPAPAPGGFRAYAPCPRRQVHPSRDGRVPDRLRRGAPPRRLRPAYRRHRRPCRHLPHHGQECPPRSSPPQPGHGQERRRRGQKSLTNLVRIISPEWTAWIRIGGKKSTTRLVGAKLSQSGRKRLSNGRSRHGMTMDRQASLKRRRQMAASGAMPASLAARSAEGVTASLDGGDDGRPHPRDCHAAETEAGGGGAHPGESAGTTRPRRRSTAALLPDLPKTGAASMTTGHAALSDETNELGRWRGPIEG
jgi:hypothetical protein